MNFSDLLTALPGSVQGYAALLIVVCNLVTVFIRPPAAGSRWVLPYRVISAVALNIGWAANHVRPGQTDKNGHHVFQGPRQP
ncbi:hypothetical protein [Bombella mellum]|uniref:Uncharacterized protein n=1 Tax=Bombella mellum TaxID=2039288 RepID=A0ABR5ZQ14_9PROT|nr:hypothetical protein [Bombella mellum]MBA5726423.1 hypothetical protein [Bombella mellum]